MIGDNIRFIRKSKKISLNELARRAQMSSGYLSELENNISSNPTMDKLQKIAKALDVSVDEFFKVSLAEELDKMINTDKLAKEVREIETKNLTSKDERDIAKDLNSALDKLESQQEGLMYNGQPLDDETRELLRISLENSMRLAKQIAKAKFTPKRHRK